MTAPRIARANRLVQFGASADVGRLRIRSERGLCLGGRGLGSGPREQLRSRVVQLDLAIVLEEGQALTALGALRCDSSRAGVRADIETRRTELGLLVGRNAELAALGAEDFSTNSTMAAAGQQTCLKKSKK